VPGDRRYAKRRAAERNGIAVTSEMLDELRGYVRA
jgi:LDH2 family malate/lactate/ureidoglycolate dehydrogenase